MKSNTGLSQKIIILEYVVLCYFMNNIFTHLQLFMYSF